MAYTTKELEEKALKAIKESNLVFINEICSFIECSESTFFNHKMQELESIKGALEKNKVAIKHGIRRNWESDGNATEKVALYKILGTQDERDALNGGSKQQESGKVEIEIIDKTIKKVEE